MQVSKQLLINNISKLPDDVLNIIKEFCFYDMPTGIMRRFITERRQEICRIFNSEYCISRKNPKKEFFDNADTEEHWVFSISNPEYVVPSRLDVHIRHTFVLQAINCSLCGNYSHYSRGTTAQNMCRCIHEDFDNEN